MGHKAQPFCMRDETCCVVATGPSAGTADLGLIRGIATIAVNDAYRLCPWADALYACDPDWWTAHIEQVRQTFAGQLWTQDERAAPKHGLNRIVGVANPGLSKTPGLIHFNSNSGAQAINLAALWGAKTIILVGFDMKLDKGKRHFFGEHPPMLRKSSDYPDWIGKFKHIAHDLKEMGVRVINTSMDSALPYFEKCPLPSATSGISRFTAAMPSSPDCGHAGSALSSGAGESRPPATA